jgi:uncharacterized phage-associated protein
MASAHDVAAYILDQRGSMSAMKLQKLVFYSQAWHLVWEEQPLFEEGVEAWANGPVVRELYARHRGNFAVSKWSVGDPSTLTDEERSSIDAILEHYGDKSAAWLSEATHREDPWRDARGDLGPSDRGTVEITQAAMAEYYGSLVS